MNDDLYKHIQELRDESEKRYAVKLVERIVFAILGAVGIAVVVKLISLINL
jgi:hypothetical protein